MKQRNFSLLTLLFAANAFAAVEGFYLEAAARGAGQDCEDVWVGVKSGNWPNLDIHSLKGTLETRRNGSGDLMACVVKKTLYGPAADLNQVRADITARFGIDYDLAFVDIHKTRYVGKFAERSGAFPYSFDLTFETFEKMINVADWHNWTCENFADCFRTLFNANGYADQIQAHFNAGHCLKNYGPTFQVEALNESGEKIATIANRISVATEICGN